MRPSGRATLPDCINEKFMEVSEYVLNPLDYAITFCHPRAFAAVLEAGADIKLPVRDGSSCCNWLAARRRCSG